MQELERLRADLIHAASSKTPKPAAGPNGAATGPALLPAGVPELPAGLRVSAEMKQLALALLESSTSTRVSFVGMVATAFAAPPRR